MLIRTTVLMLFLSILAAPMRAQETEATKTNESSATPILAEVKLSSTQHRARIGGGCPAERVLEAHAAR